MTSLNSSSASESTETSVFVSAGSPREKVDVTTEVASSAMPPGLFWRANSLARCLALPRWLRYEFSLKYVFWHTVQSFSKLALSASALVLARACRTFSVKTSEEMGGSEATLLFRLYRL